MKNIITTVFSNIFIMFFSVDLKEDHSGQIRGKAEQDIVGDQEEPLYHNEGLVPQEVTQEEDGEKAGQV